MTNTALFRETVDKRGLKYKFLADCIGITPYGLQKKIENLSEFKASEIVALCEALQLDRNEREQIFFARKVIKNHEME